MIWLPIGDSLIQAKYSAELPHKHNDIPSKSTYPLYKYIPCDPIEKTYNTGTQPLPRVPNYTYLNPDRNGVSYLAENLVPRDFDNSDLYMPVPANATRFHSPDKATCDIIAEMTSSTRAQDISPFLKPLIPFKHYNAQLGLTAYKEMRDCIQALINSNLSPEMIEMVVKTSYPHIGYFLDYWEKIKFKGQGSFSFKKKDADLAMKHWKENGCDDSSLRFKQIEFLRALSTAQFNKNALNLIEATYTRCRKK